jgi:hypothetical protein
VCELAPLLPDFELDEHNINSIDFENFYVNAKPTGL